MCMCLIMAVSENCLTFGLIIIVVSRVKNQLSVRAITRNYLTKNLALVHSFPRLH